MKNNLLLTLGLLLVQQFLLCPVSVLAQVPDFAWAKQCAGANTEVATGIAADAAGNTYVTGYFNGSAKFGCITLTSSGFMDAFVAKYDTAGNVLWARKAGGIDNVYGYAIAVDRSGNSYITGHFSSTATFGNTTLSSGGNQDIFIAKLDTYGNVLWAKRAGGAGSDEGNGIATDNSGNCYLTGWFTLVAAFDNISLGTSSDVDLDIFTAKYDAAGNAVWVKKGGSANNWPVDEMGIGITADVHGNSYVTGWFSTTATFGNITVYSYGFSDIFLIKYDPSGNVLWVRSAGGPGTDIGCSVAIDNNGNCYITGYFRGTAHFGTTELISSGDQDMFVAKYDSAGNLLWVKQHGGSNAETGYSIAVDSSGNSYITGWFEGTTLLGNTTLTSTGTADLDIFVAKFDADGDVLWARQAGGTGTDMGKSIAIDSNGNYFVAGLFTGSARFGSTTLSGSGSSKMFLTKLSTKNSQPADIRSAGLAIYPNPFTSVFRLVLPEACAKPIVIVLTDMAGREVYRQAAVPDAAGTLYVTPQKMAAGVYLLQVQRESDILTHKLVVN